MRRLASLAALLVVALSGSAAAQSAAYPDPLGYCAAANTFFNPLDTNRPVAPVELPAGFTRRRVQHGGFETVLIEGGPASATEAVVFVHGNPGSSSDWAGLLQAAPPGARVLAFDLLGFGKADKPYDFPYTLERGTDLVGQLLSSLGVQRVHLVAHDLGGVVAIEWAVRHPGRLASATLMGGGVPLGYTDHQLAQIWKTPVVGEVFMLQSTREFFVNGLQMQNSRPLPREFLDRMYDDFDRGTRCAVLKGYRSEPDVNALALRQAAALRPYDIPALVIHGERDPFVSPTVARRQTEAFPRASIHIYEGGGHWPQIEEPDRTIGLLRPFLAARLSSGAASPASSVTRARKRKRCRRGKTKKARRRVPCKRKKRRR